MRSGGCEDAFGHTRKFCLFDESSFSEVFLLSNLHALIPRDLDVRGDFECLENLTRTCHSDSAFLQLIAVKQVNVLEIVVRWLLGLFKAFPENYV